MKYLICMSYGKPEQPPEAIAYVSSGHLWDGEPVMSGLGQWAGVSNTQGASFATLAYVAEAVIDFAGNDLAFEASDLPNRRTHVAYSVANEIERASLLHRPLEGLCTSLSQSLCELARCNGFGAVLPEEKILHLWQSGDFTQAATAALKHVQLIRHLLLLGLTGRLVDPSTGKLLRLRSLPVI